MTRPTYFMGHKMSYDASYRQYTIYDDNGNTITVDEDKLENDYDCTTDVADIVRAWKYTSDDTYTDTITSTKIEAATIDLTGVSTRDLLNEAFRRGAIKQMNMKRAVASEMAQDQDYINHVKKSLRQDALASAVDELEQYGVFNVGKTENSSYYGLEATEYSVDYFICKHPLTLKKEQGYDD